MDRFLKYVNYAIAASLVVLAAALYWVLWRPLAQTTGTILATTTDRVTVRRDKLGVPHMEAANLDDIFFAQGFVTAQDRLWQMDFLRRAANGELAEVVGPAALENDRESRQFRIARIAMDQALQLTDSDRRALSAYARGVNYFIEKNQHNLPIEFTVLRYDPRPWRITDTLAIGLMMYKSMTNSYKSDLAKHAMLDGGDPQKVNQLFPARTGDETHPGSNAWALSGSHTASGKPILASDPHLEWSFPSLWYTAHLQAPNLNVIGASIPGVPGIIVGHNEKIAWGMVNLHYDVLDLYSEKLIGQNAYEFRGKQLPLRTETELIRVKGARTFELLQQSTVHGPIVLNEPNRQYSMRWMAGEQPSFRLSFLQINQAVNWTDFESALRDYTGPGMNFIYADTGGNIGFQVAGMLPVRRSFDGSIPVDGPSGENEWEGIIPFEDLPQAFNPESGMIVSSNQNPFPDDTPYHVNGNFAPYYRSHQIEMRLGSKKGWKPEEMLGIQTDVYSSFSHFLGQQAVAAVEKRQATNPALQDAVRLLKEWDGQMMEGKPAPLIVTFLFQHLRKAVAERASPGKGTGYEFQIAPAVMEHLLRERPSEWFPDWDQLLIRVFVDAIEEGQRIQGPNVNKWDYGRYTEMAIVHPVLSRIPMLNRLGFVNDFINTSTTPMRGSSTTVKQTSRRLGPSMRFVADLSEWDNSLENITIGQSGQLLSPHYKDQWESYLAGRSFLLPFQNLKGGDILVLSPAGK